MNFVKRLRMKRETTGHWPVVALPIGFCWQPWDDLLLDIHAGVKYLSFERSVDASLFPNLGGLTGCRLLMNCIRDCEGFCPQATWLLQHSEGAVGTIQGVVDDGVGNIQNIGVHPAFRRRGFGSALLRMAMHGFQLAGIRTVSLEVTATNPNAVRLYRRLGFRPYNSFYRRLERAAPAMAGAGI